MKKNNLIENNGSLVHEYLHYQNKYSKIYGADKTIVFLRCGDFYESYSTFTEGFDLTIISEITNLVKTRKNKSKDVSVSNPFMLGFQHLSLDRYVKMLMEANFTVVICDQVTPPPKCKRAITAIYSPGTYINNDQIQSNYIISLYIINESIQNSSPLKSIGLCAVDVSTGQCTVFETCSNINDNKIALDDAYRFILNYNPKEILLIGETTDDIITYLELERKKIHKIPAVNKTFERIAYQNEFFNKVYKPNSLLSPIEFLNMEMMNYARVSMITLLDFIHKYNENFIKNISLPEIFLNDKHLILFNDAIQQLNILENTTSIDSNTKIRCLLDVINHCTTPMGKRFLKYSICNPLNDIPEITLRYDCTEELINLKLNLDPQLQLITDIQKLNRRITLGSISPNDISMLVESLNVVEQLYMTINTTKFNIKYIPDNNSIKSMKDFVSVCTNTFNFDEMRKYNSISDIENSVFINGLYPEIDKLVDQIKNDGMTMDEIGVVLSKYIDGLIDPDAKTNKKITNIQLKKNKKLGCYLHLTKQKADILKEKLTDVTHIVISDSLTIEKSKLEFDDIAKTSTKIFFKDVTVNSKNSNLTHEKLKTMVKRKYSELLVIYNNLYSDMFKVISTFIAKIDFNNSNAKTAQMYNYCKPLIVDNNDKSFVDIKELRHPIVERISNTVQYVAHDICLGKNDENDDLNIDGMLIFGINSCGKSTMMKAIGLSVIMAQTGLYVPSSSFQYFPYNSLFARITNNDNIYKRESSFTHEMGEIASIIKRNNENSLVLGDELVNSTEQRSGISIVGATLVNLSKNRSTFIFASHLHELTNLEAIKNLKNLGIFHLTVDYDEKKDTLIFSRKLEKGNGDTFYGLLVAKYIVKNDDFIKLAYEIKNEIVGENNDILPTKQSKYSTNVYLDACQICHQKNTTKKNLGVLDTHHITSQHQCKVNGFAIGGQTVHDDSNLIILCKRCHYAAHHNRLLIRGYKQSSNGRIIDFEILK